MASKNKHRSTIQRTKHHWQAHESQSWSSHSYYHFKNTGFSLKMQLKTKIHPN